MDHSDLAGEYDCRPLPNPPWDLGEFYPSVSDPFDVLLLQLRDDFDAMRRDVEWQIERALAPLAI